MARRLRMVWVREDEDENACPRPTRGKLLMGSRVEGPEEEAKREERRRT